MNYSLKFLIIGTLLIALFACSEKKDEEMAADIPKLAFKLDTSLLDTKVVDTSVNLTFAPPKNWKPIPTNINQNEGRYALFEAFTHISTAYSNIFFCEKDSSILTYFSIRNIKDISPENTYDSLFNIKNNSDKIKKSKFYKDEFLVTQYLIQNEPIIIFKLIFHLKNNSVAEFNYFIKKEKYSKEIAQLIEASIASIQFNNN